MASRTRGNGRTQKSETQNAPDQLMMIFVWQALADVEAQMDAEDAAKQQASHSKERTAVLPDDPIPGDAEIAEEAAERRAAARSAWDQFTA